MRRIVQSLFVLGLVTSFAVRANAGPIIIDGTDANDHGSVSGGVNQEGWEYMQRVLENLASELTAQLIPFPKTVLSIGLSAGQANDAYNSAFNLSSLPGNGWTTSNADGAVAVDTALDNLSLATTGILYLPTAANSTGDMDVNELNQVNLHAAQIAAFVNSGGALFAMAESGTGAWGWLTTLLPGLVATDQGAGGIGTPITLTAAGFAAFPAVTATDIDGAIPWHGSFSGNLGSLQILGVAPLTPGGPSLAVIIGGGRQTTITPVPEPGTMLLVGTGAAALIRRLRRNRKA